MSAQAPPDPGLDRPQAVEPVPIDAGPAATPAPGGGLTSRQVLTTCGVAALAGTGAAWMAAGVFQGWLPRLLAVVAPVCGAAWIALSYRSPRPAPWQYATVPVALALGALVVAPSVALGSVPDRVVDALFSGGIGQPPVPFDAGWRVLLTVVGVLVAAVAASVAAGFDRPKLAVALPLPLTVGAALVQPAGAEIASTTVALVATVAGLALAFGIDLARAGATTGGFEARRLARAGAAAIGLAVVVTLLANVASFLLPASTDDRVVPPQRPRAAPPQPDRELFRVDTDRALPWRLGVLDVYQDGAWMLPPFDPERLDRVVPGQPLPGRSGRDPALTVTVTVVDVPGRNVPAPADAAQVAATQTALTVDPRTGTLRLPELPAGPITYAVTAPTPADAETLRSAGAPTGPALAFLDAPQPPEAVESLLAAAPVEPLFDRLQFVRQRFYEAVVATGPGDPVDVPPARVAELLSGDPGSPYEISAAEALLARWAGVPARIGYGYHGGEQADGGRSFRPAHGATWLEVWFEGAGWVPIVGKPPRAQASLSDAPRNPDASVRPADQFALVTYVPVRRERVTLLFEVVRHWLVRAVPAGLGAALLIGMVPAALRGLRRWRRARWAHADGPVAARARRIAVAYADLREQAWDLNIGHPARTPLEFVDDLVEDDEHRELAWLVTRALWGDLARDLSDDDVRQAEEMSASVVQRLRAAQPGFTRLAGLTSWASLREPFSDELPGPWTPATRSSARGRRRLRPRLATMAAAGLLVLAALAASSCTQPLELGEPGAGGSPLPDRLAPGRLGDLELQREPAAEEPFVDPGHNALIDHGRVLTVRRDGTIEASLQIVALRSGLEDREDEVREGIRRALGGSRFEPRRIGEDRVLALRSSERQLLLWFAPNGRWYQLLVARAAFEEADELFAAVLAHQRGEDVDDIGTRAGDRRLDPRRGIPG